MNMNAQYAMNRLVGMGYAPHQAAGIVGNLLQESGVNPSVPPGDGGRSHGIAQWNGSRLQALQGFAAQNKSDWQNLDTQLNFLHNELNTTESNAGQALRQAPDVRSATLAMAGYERPQGWTPQTPERALGFDKRLAYATQQLSPQSAETTTSTQSITMPPDMNAAMVSPDGANSASGKSTQDKMGLMLEAEKRGILPPDKLGLLNEARKRGLIDGGPTQGPPQTIPGFPNEVNQMVKGATFGLNDEATAGVVAARDAFDRGSLNNLGTAYNQSLGDIRGTEKAYEQENPLTSLGLQLGGGLATGLGGAATKAGTALTNSLRSGNLAARIGKGAAAGATSGGAYGFGTGEGEKRLESAGQGALVGGGLGAALPLGGAAFGAGSSLAQKALIPSIERGTAELAQRAQQFGIPLSLSQVAPSRVRNTVQKVSQELPFSGVGGFEKKQSQAWNSAVAKTLGQDSKNLGPTTIQAFRESNSSAFDNALVGQEYNFTNMVKKDFNSIVDEAKGSIDDGLVKIVQQNADSTWDQLKSGRISGEKLSSVRSQLLKRIVNMNDEASPFVSQMIDKIDDIATAQMPAEKIQSLAQARREWRNFKTLQPLLKKSTDGNINPTALMDKVASNKFIDASKIATGDDDLVDLARIGKQFMPKLGGSDTFQKSALSLGAAGGLGTGAFFNPLIAAKVGTGLGVNRAFQSLYNQSQGLVNKAVQKPLQFPSNINRVTVHPSDRNLPVRK